MDARSTLASFSWTQCRMGCSTHPEQPISVSAPLLVMYLWRRKCCAYLNQKMTNKNARGARALAQVVSSEVPVYKYRCEISKASLRTWRTDSHQGSTTSLIVYRLAFKTTLDTLLRSPTLLTLRMTGSLEHNCVPLFPAEFLIRSTDFWVTNHATATCLGPGVPIADRALGVYMSRSWASFAATGDPNNANGE